MPSATLLDFSKRLDQNDKIAKIIEILNQQNQLLLDMPFMEGNLPTGTKTTIRTGLPSATWRKLNWGVQPQKSTTKQVTENCGMLETYSEVDKELVSLNDNKAEFRLSEDKAFIEGMTQQMVQTVFYGDTASYPDRFMGLDPRFNKISGAENGANVISGGGSGSVNTSIWLVVWGDNTVHGLYPKGSVAGLQTQDLGEQTIIDTNGGRYQAFRSHYQWKAGLAVRDWRYIVRICNVDTANLISGTGAADLVKLLVTATELIPNLDAGRPVFYANRTVRTALRNQILAKSNVNLTYEQVAGKLALSFDGIPIRRCDQLISTEATIS